MSLQSFISYINLTSRQCLGPHRLNNSRTKTTMNEDAMTTKEKRRFDLFVNQVFISITLDHHIHCIIKRKRKLGFCKFFLVPIVQACAG